MNTGSDRRAASPAACSREERTPEIAAVPPALHTLRAIVLGVAAVIGAMGALAFVRVPDVVPEVSDAAARSGLAAGQSCEMPCLGRAVGVRELDVLPVGLDAGALAVVARAEPEPPMAATPPPGTGQDGGERRHDDDHERDDDRERDDDHNREDEGAEEKKGGKKGKAAADGSPGKGHGKDRADNDDD